jgi:NADH-quinone oxidoreductase subunit L
MMKMTFFGESKSTQHPHESGPIMTVPLIILAVLAAVSGFFSFPEGLGHIFGFHFPAYLEHWLSPLLPAKEIGEFGFLGELGATLVASAVSLLGLGIALVLFAKSTDFPFATKLLERKFYVDEIYDWLLVKPLQKLGGGISGAVEFLVQGFADGLKYIAQATAAELKSIQTGDMQGSIVILVGGVVFFIAIFFIW